MRVYCANRDNNMCFYNIRSATVIICGTGLPDCWSKEMKISHYQLPKIFYVESLMSEFMSKNNDDNLKDFKSAGIGINVRWLSSDQWFVSLFITHETIKYLISAGLSKASIQVSFDRAICASFDIS